MSAYGFFCRFFENTFTEKFIINQIFEKFN